MIVITIIILYKHITCTLMISPSTDTRLVDLPIIGEEQMHAELNRAHEGTSKPKCPLLCVPGDQPFPSSEIPDGFARSTFVGNERNFLNKILLLYSCRLTDIPCSLN